MKGNLQAALDNTETVYSDLIYIANDIVKEHTSEIDKIISEAADNIDSLTNENIRHLILQLSLKSYCFSDIKERSLLKSECAETLKKEAYANQYCKAEGPVATKENTATINISNEIMVEAIYGLVASLFKTKSDELHRCVDSLKSVLMSRMQEAKLTANMYESEAN